MRSLFWRVLAWYLASIVVVLAISLAAVMVTDPEFSITSSISVSRDALVETAESSVKTWKQGGPAALVSTFNKAQRSRYLFGDNGAELSGRASPGEIQALMRRAQSTTGIELEFLSRRAYAALPLTVNGQRFVFVTALPRERRYTPLSSPMPGWVRIALGLLTAAVICVIFAHYVLTPIHRLRAATREVASGNLEVRIGTGWPFNRKDEFTDLASDFDNMAAKIQELVVAQNRMLSDISHELRSPLTRLQLALEMARRRVGPAASEQFDRIEQETERLNILIGQILHAAKTEQIHPKMKKLFDLANLVREVAEDADFEATASDRQVIVRASEPALVHGDRDLLRSAIENVVRNAIRYTPANSQVTIDLRRSDATSARVVVRDQGDGVPAEALPHIFKPFYRVNDARDRDSGGAGLGLAITNHVVQAHGGKVRAHNREGGGFEIDIEVPLKSVEGSGRTLRFR